jgi:hypothetical protein
VRLDIQINIMDVIIISVNNCHVNSFFFVLLDKLQKCSIVLPHVQFFLEADKRQIVDKLGY